jgi:hypothetical protein
MTNISWTAMGMESLFWSIDFSKWFSDWYPSHMDFSVPSEHTQEGKRYGRANVPLSVSGQAAVDNQVRIELPKTVTGIQWSRRTHTSLFPIFADGIRNDLSEAYEHSEDWDVFKQTHLPVARRRRSYTSGVWTTYLRRRVSLRFTTDDADIHPSPRDSSAANCGWCASLSAPSLACKHVGV